jgi:hypothetical protein
LWIASCAVEPQGITPRKWRFSGPPLRRVRTARRRAQDFEINARQALRSSWTFSVNQRIAAFQAFVRSLSVFLRSSTRGRAGHEAMMVCRSA